MPPEHAVLCTCSAQLQPHTKLTGVCDEAGDEWDRGDWMQLYSGKRYHPLDPRVEDIDPLDIAHALSMLCRYGGHITRFYSVAEHCILMSLAVPPQDALAALLHDATEAYVVDVPRPVKRYIPDYKAIEARVWSVIARRFGIPEELPESVHDADNRILRNESAELMPSNGWSSNRELLPVTIVGMHPAQAEAMYLARLKELLP